MLLFHEVLDLSFNIVAFPGLPKFTAHVFSEFLIAELPSRAVIYKSGWQ
jgi:hypothetical protein